MAEGMDAMGPGPTSLKVDIKGLEEEVLLSVPKEQLSGIDRIFVEALGVGAKLGDRWRTTTRPGYVKIIDNLRAPASTADTSPSCALAEASEISVPVPEPSSLGSLRRLFPVLRIRRANTCATVTTADVGGQEFQSPTAYP